MLTHANLTWAAELLPPRVRHRPRRRGPLLPAAVPRRRAAELGHQRPRHRLRRQLRRGRRVVRAGPARRPADALPGRPARVGEDARDRRDQDDGRLAAQALVYRTAMRHAPGRLGEPAGPARPARQARARPRASARICGAAPIAPQVLEYFWTLGVPVYEIYGQTENTAVCTLMPFDDVRIGTVGKPLDGVELRIADDGEILTRSPAVFAGYFKDPDATAATDRRRRLAAHRRRRRDRRRRLPDDHRPQEGHHHHRRRQERLAVGDREPPEGLAVRARGDGGRRPPQVPRRPDRHRGRHGVATGRPAAASPFTTYGDLSRKPEVRELIGELGRRGQRRPRPGRRRSSASRCSRRSSTTRTASSPPR